MGQGLEGRARRWYHGAMAIGASGSVMANRYNWLDLDPTYHNAFGQPLMRMTFDCFTDCAAGHSLMLGANNIGPSLAGLFGRKAGTIADFRYSPAFSRILSARALFSK
jgi:hypothetical protein